MKKLLIVLLACLIAFPLSACTSGGNKVESAADENGDYHIAVSLPYTGTNASYAKYIEMGLKVALKNLEEDGWLNGDGTGKLILDYYDDITLFDLDVDPLTVSYYQMKTRISMNCTP